MLWSWPLMCSMVQIRSKVMFSPNLNDVNLSWLESWRLLIMKKWSAFGFPEFSVLLTCDRESSARPRFSGFPRPTPRHLPSLFYLPCISIHHLHQLVSKAKIDPTGLDNWCQPCRIITVPIFGTTHLLHRLSPILQPTTNPLLPLHHWTQTTPPILLIHVNSIFQIRGPPSSPLHNPGHLSSIPFSHHSIHTHYSIWVMVPMRMVLTIFRRGPPSGAHLMTHPNRPHTTPL